MTYEHVAMILAALGVWGVVMLIAYLELRRGNMDPRMETQEEREQRLAINAAIRRLNRDRPR